MTTRTVTKSIRLSPEESAEVSAFVRATGEVEASVLKRAMLRGLNELQIEQAIVSYLRDSDSAAAAEIARVPRARFLEILTERGIPLLRDAATVDEEIAYLADALGSARLKAALIKGKPERG